MSATDTTTDRSAGPVAAPARLGEPAGRVVRAAIWLPGLAVALGAAVATAHGLYETALAARVPAAWLYPLITDGLALVAYTATARLTGSAARYAWSVVVLAAGLSGLAQAAYLAGGASVDAPPVLRFGIGAWPAIAAAIVAHLLYLLATDPAAAAVIAKPGDPPRPHSADTPIQPAPFSRTTAVQSPRSTVQPDLAADGAAVTPAVQPPAAVRGIEHQPPASDGPVEQPVVRPVESSARERARTAAERHAARHGALPTVTELEAAAEVSRGTAAAVLKALRDRPTPLHLITRSEYDDDPAIEEDTQP